MYAVYYKAQDGQHRRDLEDLLDARNQEHSMVRLLHHRAAFAQSGIVRAGVADDLRIREEI